jgi:hypothetical protein
MKIEIPPMEGKLLRLPIQVAPVERAVVPSALTGSTGVEASAWWNDIISALPAIVQGVSLLA